MLALATAARGRSAFSCHRSPLPLWLGSKEELQTWLAALACSKAAAVEGDHATPCGRPKRRRSTAPKRHRDLAVPPPLDRPPLRQRYPPEHRLGGKSGSPELSDRRSI